MYRLFLLAILLVTGAVPALSTIGPASPARLLRFPDIRGDLIAFVYAGDIWTVSSSGGTARRLTSHPGLELTPKFSPDGRWVVFTSDESGREEVFVVPFPGPGGRIPISNEGGTAPRWGRDGTEIFYMGPRLTLMAVAVNGQNPEFEVRTVTRLFEAVFRTENYQGYGPGSVYDVALDGQRFLTNLVTATEQPAETPLTIVTNWTSSLRAER